MTGERPAGQVPWLTAAEAIDRYIEVAHRFPSARFPARSEYRAHLGELRDEIDVFVLDGFGVLNLGNEPVPSAIERLPQLRQQGALLRVLTNGATFPSASNVGKYRGMGIDFVAEEIVSSRDALIAAMASAERQACRWGIAALDGVSFDDIAPDTVRLADDPAVYAGCDGFVLLGTGDWSNARHQLMRQALHARPRPVLVGNPDLVAPFPEGVTREPGLFAHALADEGLCEPEFCGKPCANAFEQVWQRLPGDIDPQRIAMVGDTLHTDILGGASAGWRTVLVTDYGIMREQDVEDAISRSGIRPDFIVATT